MKAIIIEDEEPARDLLRKFIEPFSDIEVIGEYIDGFEGAKAINQLKPDIVFLDIQLPRLTGIEVLELLDHTPMIVFTTAYDEFAIKAFEKNAVDYLMKPFSKERFAQAIERVKSRLNAKQPQENGLQQLTENFTAGSHLSRIVVRTPKAMVVIPVEDILYLEAQDDYIMIHTTESRHLKKQTMKYFEERLNTEQFVRIHRSYIVNVSHISKLEPYSKDAYIAVLKNGAKLNVSSTGYKSLKDILSF
ncbi:MAG: response regulator [Bacteroidales bacterium]|nr:MAG: response regulator [Bacteroidales bacterium]